MLEAKISYGYEKLYFRIVQLVERYESEVEMLRKQEKDALKKADEMLGAGNLPQWDLQHEIAQSYALSIKVKDQIIIDLRYNLSDIDWIVQDDLDELNGCDIELDDDDLESEDRYYDDELELDDDLDIE